LPQNEELPQTVPLNLWPVAEQKQIPKESVTFWVFIKFGVIQFGLSRLTSTPQVPYKKTSEQLCGNDSFLSEKELSEYQACWSNQSEFKFEFKYKSKFGISSSTKDPEANIPLLISELLPNWDSNVKLKLLF
jgi:hypothetical protein